MMSDAVEKCCERHRESCTAQFHKIWWMIPDYFSLSDAATNALDSPSFTFANVTWCFRLRSNVLEDETAVSLVRLHPLRSSLPKIVYKFGIKLGNLGYYSVNKYEVLHHNRNMEFRFQSSLLAANQKTFAADDTLELMCHIFHENSRKNNAISKNVLRQRENSEYTSLFYRYLFFVASHFYIGCLIHGQGVRGTSQNLKIGLVNK